MARYSSSTDINDKVFQENVSEPFHVEAQEYLDITLRDAQLDPTALTKKYDVLKTISIMKAKELYLESISGQSDAIVEQMERIRRNRIDMERRFLPGVLERIKKDIGSDTSVNLITFRTGRVYRA